MSYFTDDSPYKSNMEPLVVDNNNLPEPELGLWEQTKQEFKREANSGLLMSRQFNIGDKVAERAKFLEEELGPDYVDKLKPFGYERGLLQTFNAEDPRLYGNDDQAFEDALKLYRETLPADKKSRLFVGKELEQAAKEEAIKVEAETGRKLQNTKYGWWGGIFGTIGAHLTDPFEVMMLGFVPNAIAGRFIAKAGQASLAKRAGIYAGTEAGVAATFETPNQFLNVKPYKNELGIKYTNQDAANAVMAATVLSAVFAGTFEFGAGAYRKVATGEWTPQQAKQHLAENYDKYTQEQREMADMGIEAMDHELSNPYGPSPEGRAKHNKEVAEEYKRLDAFERPLTETDIKANKGLLERAQSPEDLEFEELRAEALREAGIQDPLRRVEEPEAPITQQPEINPLEAQFRSLTDGLEVGDELAVKTLADAGLNEGQVREVIDYAVRSGILTKDADGKITLAKRVDDPDNPVVEGDSRLEELEARQFEGEEPNAKPTDNNRTALKINNGDFVIDFDGEKFTPEQLIKSADNDIAQAENLKLCVLMGER